MVYLIKGQNSWNLFITYFKSNIPLCHRIFITTPYPTSMLIQCSRLKTNSIHLSINKIFERAVTKHIWKNPSKVMVMQVNISSPLWPDQSHLLSQVYINPCQISSFNIILQPCAEPIYSELFQSIPDQHDQLVDLGSCPHYSLK